MAVLSSKPDQSSLSTATSGVTEADGVPDVVVLTGSDDVTTTAGAASKSPQSSSASSDTAAAAGDKELVEAAAVEDEGSAVAMDAEGKSMNVCTVAPGETLAVKATALLVESTEIVGREGRHGRGRCVIGYGREAGSG